MLQKPKALEASNAHHVALVPETEKHRKPIKTDG